MGVEENKAILQRYFDEVLNKGNHDVMEELMDEDFNGAPSGGTISGRDAHIAYFDNARAIFPDLYIETLEMVAEGDKVVALSKWHYTHSGIDYLGFPASGKSGAHEVMAMYTIINGMLTGGEPSCDCSESKPEPIPDKKSSCC